MDKLSPAELDILARIDEKEELRPFFFRKVKGLKWFYALSERGYFDAEAIPEPIPSKEEGYVSIPPWPAIDYLVETTPLLSEEDNRTYSEKFLNILVKATTYARENKISNYRTWWQFAEIISKLPKEVISVENIDIVDFWLDDRYECGLVAGVIGEKWLSKLLQESDSHSLRLSRRIIEVLYKIKFFDREFGDKKKLNASLRFDYHHADKINKITSSLAGEKLGREAVEIFDSTLKNILEQLNNDLWSSVWQPAIEDHEQNKHRYDAEHIVVRAYRDCMEGYISTRPDEATEYVKTLLLSDYNTIRRLAIHIIDKHFKLFTGVVDKLLNQQYLECNYRHEMWHFLNKNYPVFSEPSKDKIIELISMMTRHDENEEYHLGASAYDKSIWFAALKEHGDRERKLYTENIEIAQVEPEHPDFSSYTSVRWGGRESPKALEELQVLSLDELIEQLDNYKDNPGRFDEPGLEGLLSVFKELIMSEPLKFYLHLERFLHLDLAYTYEIIEAYQSLWMKKEKLPWNGIWEKVLDFILTIIKQESFWDLSSSGKRGSFIANRSWVTSSIGRLIESGTKTDSHAFNEKYLPVAEEIISHILSREEGGEYKEESDAVSISINSSRGRCLEALINLTLRSCRIQDKNNNKDHSKAWSHFQPYYDSELSRPDLDKPEYEFSTLVTNYLPNFLYMSKEWVISNLNRIFDQSNYMKWLCAMQGYSYVGTIYQEIYQYLKNHGDLIKALNDTNIKKRVEEKIIQNIAIAYVNDFEELDEEHSLISTLICGNNHIWIKHLIWFIWSLRDKRDDKLKNKVYKLWPLILSNSDLSTKNGRQLASHLCRWSVFVDNVDEEILELLLKIAPYSDESHNSTDLLESISKISEAQPFEAHTIWMKMVDSSAPDYPEDAVKNIFSNLLKRDHEGLRKAKQVASQYLMNGNDRPSKWLTEIQVQTH